MIAGNVSQAAAQIVLLKKENLYTLQSQPNKISSRQGEGYHIRSEFVHIFFRNLCLK